MSIATILYLMAILSEEYQYNKYIKNKKTKILLMLLLACCCHSAAITCLVLFLPIAKLSRNFLTIMLAITSLLGTVIAPIILNFFVSHVGGYLSLKLAEYMEAAMAGHTITRILYYSVTIFILLNYNRLVKKNPRNKFFISLITLGCCFNGLFWINPHLGVRLCSFYSVTMLLVIIDLIYIYISYL
jgi:hypothetical protein